MSQTANGSNSAEAAITSKNNIPVLDLKAQYETVGAQIEQTVLQVLRSGNYILGQLGSSLENEVATICGVRFGVGVANGTDALILALWAANIGPGDEVITPPFTFAATAEAIALRGARPIFVDVDPNTFNLNPKAVESAITARTKALLPVHLYGQPADMDPLLELAERHGLYVIEDNAQAIGASYKGRPTGSLGHMACVSFYPTKNLGAAGDAGMIVTDNEELSNRLKILRAHGCRERYYHDELGVNSRLDEIQAAVLLAKLPYLATWNEQRNKLARLYDKGLKNVPGIVTPNVMLRSTHVWHQYTIRVTPGSPAMKLPVTRDELKAELAKRNIGSMCYYPVPLHLQKAFCSYGYIKGDMPISEALSREVLSLPMYPEMTEEQVRQVCKSIEEIMLEKSSAVSPVATPSPSF